MFKYLLLFVFAFIYEFGLVSFNRAVANKNIKKSLFFIGIYEPQRYFMIGIIASAKLGSLEQLFLIATVVFSFQVATFISLKYFDKKESDREDD